jgi:hypothetical protein
MDRPKPRAVRNVRTFGDLIDLHDEDMREVGKPPRRSKAAVMASLKTELGSVKLAERLADGEWRVVPDHLDRAARFEEANRLQRPVQMTVLSWQNLEALPGAVGATWLDRQLVAKAPETIAPTGMGSEVGSALRVRRQWLLDQRLAREQGGRILYARNLLQTLERRELAEVGARIASETGLGYAEIKRGDQVSGTYRRMLTLNSGRFALIERAHDFVLVPWRPVPERARGKRSAGASAGRAYPSRSVSSAVSDAKGRCV